MPTTRQITTLLGRHLGVDVAPYAARLVRERLLPRGGEPIDEWEAAILLLAVTGASDPSRAFDAVRELKNAALARRTDKSDLRAVGIILRSRQF